MYPATLHISPINFSGNFKKNSIVAKEITCTSWTRGCQVGDINNDGYP